MWIALCGTVQLGIDGILYSLDGRTVFVRCKVFSRIVITLQIYSGVGLGNALQCLNSLISSKFYGFSLFLLKTDTDDEAKISCCKLAFRGSETADSDSTPGADELNSDKLLIRLGWLQGGGEHS